MPILFWKSNRKRRYYFLGTIIEMNMKKILPVCRPHTWNSLMSLSYAFALTHAHKWIIMNWNFVSMYPKSSGGSIGRAIAPPRRHGRPLPRKAVQSLLWQIRTTTVTLPISKNLQ